MKTKDKIKDLCKRKYNISLTLYEERLGFGNGSLSKGGFLRSDRLLIVALDLGVSMESLMDDDLLPHTAKNFLSSNVVSDDDMEIIRAFRSIDKGTQGNIRLLLGIPNKQKRDIG